MTQARKEQLDVLRAHWSVYTYTATAGTTSTTLPGAFPLSSITSTNGGNADTTPPVRGIITAGTNNFVKLRKVSDALTLDDGGAQIFGRLTYSAGNYIVTYKKISGGAEVSATLPGAGSYSVNMTYPEVMRFGEVPTKADIIFAQNAELVTTGSSISGDLTVTGNTTLGDNSSDTLTFNARLASNFVPTPDNLRSLGASSLRFADSHSVQYTARADITDTIKSIFSATGIAIAGTPFTIDGANIMNLGTTLATQVVIGRTGINVDIDGILDVATTATIGGNLTVNGSASSFTGNLSVSGTLTVGTLSPSNLSVTGNTILGDNVSDTIITTARLASNLLPGTNDTYSLGNSSLKFLSGHFLNLFAEDIDGYAFVNIGATHATDIQLGNSSAVVTLNSPLTVAGTAGESLSVGELIAYDDSGGAPRIYKAEADGYGDKSFVTGVAMMTVTAGQTINVAILGELSIPDSEWDIVPSTTDVGKLVYLSTNAGNWALTAPATSGSYVQKCGIISRGGAGNVKVVLQIGDTFIN